VKYIYLVLYFSCKYRADSEAVVGNELVHAGSHARPQAVDRGMPSQRGSTESWYLYLIKCHEPTVREIPPVANHLCYVYSDRVNKNPNTHTQA